MQKVTFSMCFLRCSGILNFYVNYVHTDSGKPQKSQGKLFFLCIFVAFNCSLNCLHTCSIHYVVFTGIQWYMYS